MIHLTIFLGTFLLKIDVGKKMLNIELHESPLPLKQPTCMNSERFLPNFTDVIVSINFSAWLQFRRYSGGLSCAKNVEIRLQWQTWYPSRRPLTLVGPCQLLSYCQPPCPVEGQVCLQWHQSHPKLQWPIRPPLPGDPLKPLPLRLLWLGWPMLRGGYPWHPLMEAWRL